MEIKTCTPNDIPLLAQMNELLIEDENAETNLSLPQLEARMAGFIATNYKAFLFYADPGHSENAVGYALCDMSKTPIYLRQFFICRNERRKGYGRQAFRALIEYIGTREIDIDVYAWNETGVSFWESLGFARRYYAMRYKTKG